MASTNNKRSKRLSIPKDEELEERLEKLAGELGEGFSATNAAVLAMREGLPLLESRYFGWPLPEAYRLGLGGAHQRADVATSAPQPAQAGHEPVPGSEPTQGPGTAPDEVPDVELDLPPDTADEAPIAGEGPLLPDLPDEADTAEPPAPGGDVVKEALSELLEAGVPVEEAYERARKMASGEPDNVVPLTQPEPEAEPEFDPLKCQHGVRFDAKDGCSDCEAAGY